MKIKTLIFDFGDVFINLDKKGALANALALFNLEAFDTAMITINNQFETGLITTSEFIQYYNTRFPHLSHNQILEAWNFIIKDFPIQRLKFVKQLADSKKYTLILLSNTNALHIDYIKAKVDFYNEFKNCFDAFYLSHEIKLRKPNASIFEYVLTENNLNANECLFIDDTKENTDTALQLGFQVWHLDETKDDVCQLFQLKNTHF